MKTFTIAICDDDWAFVDFLCQRVNAVMIENNWDGKIKKLYSGEELTEYCGKNPPDIIITDIDMPEDDNIPMQEGFKAVEELQKQYPDLEIMFVTAHKEYSYKSYRYKPDAVIYKKDLDLFDDELTELCEKRVNPAFCVNSKTAI